MTTHEHIGDADLDSIRGQLDDAAITEREVNTDRTDRLEAIERRLQDGGVRMEKFENLLSVNTAQTLATAEITRDVHEMLLAWRAGMNAIAKFGHALIWFGKWMMRIAKFGGVIAGGIYTVWLLFYTFMHGGPKP